jgi:hypothetical protein
VGDKKVGALQKLRRPGSPRLFKLLEAMIKLLHQLLIRLFYKLEMELVTYIVK